MAGLALARLRLRCFRNLAPGELEPSAAVNLITGRNGQGKTALLEAIYFAATSRSFRTARVAELVQHGAEGAAVVAGFHELAPGFAPILTEQVAAIQQGRVTLRLNGDKPPSLSSYAARAPVVTFHPGDLQLTAGPASERRTFLDRVAFYLRPEGAVDRARYAHALRSRQLLLRRGGSPTELAAFESLCARHGAALTTARRVATEAVQEHLGAAFASIADPALELRVAYAPGGSSDEDEAATRLLNNRAADAQRPSPAYGPHRDELDLRLSGRVARQVASQGQHRALTLALKAAEAAAVGAARGVEPILLLDDVSSELDAERSDALLRFLGAAHGQLFLTTTRPELFEASVLSRSETAHFLVEKGTFQRV